MALTPIEILRFADSTGDTAGTTTADGTSGLPYWTWALTNVRRFTVRVPVGFTAGTAITVNLVESTPNTSRRHKWQFLVTLIEPEVDATNISAAATYTSEIVSSSVANRAMPKSIAITTAGQIASTTPAAGDLVTIVMSRVAASADEDAADIKLFNLNVQFDVDLSAISGCLGRVGTIMDRVFRLFNEVSNEHLTNSEILDWIVQCTERVSQYEYWRKTTSLDVVAAQTAYDLLTLITDYERVIKVRYTGDGTAYDLELFQTKADFDDEVTAGGLIVSGTQYSRCAWIDSNTLNLAWTPGANITGALEVYHSYYPGDLDCDTNYVPKIPRGHDNLYTYFCLEMAFMKDKTNEYADTHRERYHALFERELNDLMGQQIDQDFGVRPG